MADNFGPRRILALSVIWWGVFTSLITFVPATVAAFAIIMAIRFGLGIGEAVVYPASNKVVASWIPSQERGLANGLIFAGVGFGAGVTPPLITYVLVTYGWRASFWCSAVIGLAAGAIWYWLARDTPAEHLLGLSRRSLLHRRRHSSRCFTPKAGRLTWSEILRNKDVVIVTLSYFSYGYAAWIFFSWFFIYLNDVRGLNLKQSAILPLCHFSPWLSGRLLAAG